MHKKPVEQNIKRKSLGVCVFVFSDFKAHTVFYNGLLICLYENKMSNLSSDIFIRVPVHFLFSSSPFGKKQGQSHRGSSLRMEVRYFSLTNP